MPVVAVASCEGLEDFPFGHSMVDSFHRLGSSLSYLGSFLHYQPYFHIPHFHHHLPSFVLGRLGFPKLGYRPNFLVVVEAFVAVASSEVVDIDVVVAAAESEMLVAAVVAHCLVAKEMGRFD